VSVCIGLGFRENFNNDQILMSMREMRE